MLKNPNALPQDQLLESFRSLSRLLAAYGERGGTTITPYHDESLPLFSILPESQQIIIIQELTRLTDFCGSLEIEGWELKELKQLVWYAIRRLGARPPGGEVMELIEDGDVVEIHDGDQQIFRSFTYYDFCSYTVEELISLHWSELFERDPEILNLMLQAIEKTMTENKIVVDPVPTHRVVERRSPMRHQILYNAKYFIPLCERGSVKPRYFLVIIKAELLGETARADDSYFENYVRSKGDLA